jgi:predicted DNA binding CopG/RHH family protein
MKNKTKLKPMPPLLSDVEAEEFVDTADLTEYDLSGFKPVRLEMLAKEARVMLRLPRPLLNAVKAEADKQKMPYSRFIRMTLEHALSPSG